MNLSTSGFLLKLAFALCTCAVSASLSATPIMRTQAKSADDSAEPLLGFASLTIDYSVSGNTIEQVEPRSIRHAMNLTLDHEFWRTYRAFLSAGVQYQTVNSAVYRTNSNDNYFTGNDITLGFSRSFQYRRSNFFAFTLSEDVLTSELSRYLGYRNVIGIQGSMNTKILSYVSLAQSLQTSYISNRYRYAPVSVGHIQVGDINPDSIISYSVGPNFRLYKGLTLSGIVTVRATHYLDNSDVYGFGNSFRLNYSIKKMNLWAMYINQGYADRGETNLWFADRYRGLALAGFSVSF